MTNTVLKPTSLNKDREGKRHNQIKLSISSSIAL